MVAVSHLRKHKLGYLRNSQITLIPKDIVMIPPQLPRSLSRVHILVELWIRKVHQQWPVKTHNSAFFKHAPYGVNLTCSGTVLCQLSLICCSSISLTCRWPRRERRVAGSPNLPGIRHNILHVQLTPACSCKVVTQIPRCGDETGKFESGGGAR